ncbi:hypothetical protein HAX54_046421, partial [Datura stramonium]|nr:hypothetical protein [Datura stramonium]
KLKLGDRQSIQIHVIKSKTKASNVEVDYEDDDLYWPVPPLARSFTNIPKGQGEIGVNAQIDAQGSMSVEVILSIRNWWNSNLKRLS